MGHEYRPLGIDNGREKGRTPSRKRKQGGAFYGGLEEEKRSSFANVLHVGLGGGAPS